MPTYPHIEQYRAYLQQLKDFGGSDNELSIRPAFQNCLDAYCREHREKLGLVPELSAVAAVKGPIGSLSIIRRPCHRHPAASGS
jgi:hypothetical protein